MTQRRRGWWQRIYLAIAFSLQEWCGQKGHLEFISNGYGVPNRPIPWHDCICGPVSCLPLSTYCPSLTSQPSTIQLGTDCLRAFPFLLKPARVSFYSLDTRTLTDTLNLNPETKTFITGILNNCGIFPKNRSEYLIPTQWIVRFKNKQTKPLLTSCLSPTHNPFLCFDSVLIRNRFG